MSESFQNEVPKARVNIKLDLHTGGASKKVELPLKLLVMGDYSNGQNNLALGERTKVSVNKNNFDSVLAELNPKARIAVPNTLNDEGGDLPVDLDFKEMKDFSPERVARRSSKSNRRGADCISWSARRTSARTSRSSCSMSRKTRCDRTMKTRRRSSRAACTFIRKSRNTTRRVASQSAP